MVTASRFDRLTAAFDCVRFDSGCRIDESRELHPHWCCRDDHLQQRNTSPSAAVLRRLAPVGATSSLTRIALDSRHYVDVYNYQVMKPASYGMSTPERLDATFMALADPTRRAILARLAKGELSVTELAAPFAMSQPAISKHLKVLEARGLGLAQAGCAAASVPDRGSTDGRSDGLARTLPAAVGRQL